MYLKCLRVCVSVSIAAGALSGCGELLPADMANRPETTGTTAPDTAAPPPPESARTVEQFDTTTAEQRAAAAAPEPGGRLLGTTVATLGDPGRPGFWIETTLTSNTGSGRLRYGENGKSVEVDLIPISSGGSRVSLAAVRVLEAPLTALLVLDVYAQ